MAGRIEHLQFQITEIQAVTLVDVNINARSRRPAMHHHASPQQFFQFESPAPMVSMRMSIDYEVKFETKVCEYSCITIGVLLKRIDERRRFGNLTTDQISLAFASVQFFEEHHQHLFSYGVETIDHP